MWLSSLAWLRPPAPVTPTTWALRKPGTRARKVSDEFTVPLCRGTPSRGASPRPTKPRGGGPVGIDPTVRGPRAVAGNASSVGTAPGPFAVEGRSHQTAVTSRASIALEITGCSRALVTAGPGAIPSSGFRRLSYRLLHTRFLVCFVALERSAGYRPYLECRGWTSRMRKIDANVKHRRYRPVNCSTANGGGVRHAQNCRCSP